MSGLNIQCELSKSILDTFSQDLLVKLAYFEIISNSLL